MLVVENSPYFFMNLILCHLELKVLWSQQFVGNRSGQSGILSTGTGGLNMGGWTFWALPWAVFLLVTACLTVRSDGASDKTNTTSPNCPSCKTKACQDTPATCHKQCKDECQASFYRVRLVSRGECFIKYDDAVILKLNEPLSIEQEKPKVLVTEQATTTVPTTSTRQAPNIWLCKYCSLVGCVRCRDSVAEPICEDCGEGYVRNNSTFTCTAISSDETALSAVAIAGIVIAVLCLLGIAALGIFVLVRRFRRSLNLSRANKKVKMPPVINERVGWSRDPESAEIEALEIAPERPEINSNQYSDIHQSYDMLAKGDQAEQSSYAPLNLSQEDLYINTTATQARSVYVNPQTAASKPPPLAATRQESGQLYEDVQARSTEDDSDHIYGNNVSSAPFQTVVETSEGIYANNEDDNTEDFYQNT